MAVSVMLESKTLFTGWTLKWSFALEEIEEVRLVDGRWLVWHIEVSKRIDCPTVCVIWWFLKLLRSWKVFSQVLHLNRPAFWERKRLGLLLEERRFSLKPLELEKILRVLRFNWLKTNLVDNKNMSGHIGFTDELFRACRTAKWSLSLNKNEENLIS